MTRVLAVALVPVIIGATLTLVVAATIHSRLTWSGGDVQ